MDTDQRAVAPPQGVDFGTDMNNATLPAPFRLLGLQHRESDLKSEMEKLKDVLTVVKKKGDEEVDINVLIKSPKADKEEDRYVYSTIPGVCVNNNIILLIYVM